MPLQNASTALLGTSKTGVIVTNTKGSALSKAAAEKCAARMARTLNGKPKHDKTRGYVNTLPPRRVMAHVAPEDFGYVAEQVILELATEALSPPAAPVVRKDRIRPRGLGTDHLREKVVFRAPRDMQVCRVNRIKLYMAQRGQCGICGDQIKGGPRYGSLDHVVPLYLGGLDRLSNLALTHGVCNGRKSNRAPTAFEIEMCDLKNQRLGIK